MKQTWITLLFLIVVNVLKAQPCTKAEEANQPGSFERETKYNGNRIKEPTLKKTAEAIEALMVKAIENAKGLHGFYDVSHSDYGTDRLSAFKASIIAFSIHCQKDGSYSWKGMFNFVIDCMANDIRELAQPLSNDNIGVGRDKQVLINNSPIYILNDKTATDYIKGFPYYKGVSSDGVFVTKSKVKMFTPVTRKEYLLSMKKNTEATLKILQKNLVEFQQTKQVAAPGSDMDKGNKEVEELNNKMIADAKTDIREIDQYASMQDNGWLNAPCITIHNFEPPYGHSFSSDKQYFTDEKGHGGEWVIINPNYINKSVPANAPQFFFVRWRTDKSEFEKVKSIAEERAIEMFKQNFDFVKLASFLQ